MVHTLRKKYSEDSIPRKDIKMYASRNTDKVVVSLTTIPSRIKNLERVVESLKSQTYQPDIIYLNIPYKLARKNEEYVVPDNWDLPDNVIITRGEDFGPATKLLGSIKKIDDPNTIIITLDDDWIYNDRLIECLVAYSVKYPDSALTYYAKGYSPLDPLIFAGRVVSGPQIRYPCGFCGVLYRRSFVTEDMYDYLTNKDLSLSCFLSDDLTFGTWLKINKIPLRHLCGEYLPKSFAGGGFNKDSLMFNSRAKVYSACSKELNDLKMSYDMG